MKDNMDLVEANDRDVISGRGNRISGRAGNVHFRKIINQFRHEYVSAARDRKVEIALRVMDIVAKNGSRFLQETESGSNKYYRISDARAIEKCCQALREKVLPIAYKGTPIEKVPKKRDVPSRGNKKGKSSSPNAPAASKKSKKKSPPVALKLPLTKQKRKNARKHSISNSSESSGKPHDGVGETKPIRISPIRSLLPKKGDAIVKTPEPKKEKIDIITSIPAIAQPDIVLLMESPMDRLKRLSAEEMLRRLDRFIDEYHHAAVPPGWPADPDLADWCTIQRQHLRMAKKGYKELGAEENKLLTKLSSLNFVWDYDERNLNQTTTKA